MKKFLEKWQWLIATISAAGLLAVVFTKKNEIMKAVKNTVSDLKSNGLIAGLHPAAQEPARRFLNNAETAGINLIITSG